MADAAVMYSKLGESTIDEINVAKMGTLNFRKTDIDGRAFEQNSQKPFQASMTFFPSTSVMVTVDAAAAAAAVVGVEATVALFDFPSPFFPFLVFPSPFEPFEPPFPSPF